MTRSPASIASRSELSRINRVWSSVACLFVAIGWAHVESAHAWGARGHRAVTHVAVDLARAELGDAADLLRDDRLRAMVEEQSNEPDRWRGTRALALMHVNNPDHYLDVEDLAQFGLTLRSIPPLRQEYFRAMAVSKHVHPELVERPYDPTTDPEKVKEWPGFLPHAIVENYHKLRSSFNTYRILRELEDPARATELELSRLNIIHHMGVLSHFVGDAAQPLHTTRHFNGWVGDNPEGFTTDKGFHAYIDSGVVALHELDADDVRAAAGALPALNMNDPWDAVLTHIERSFEKMVPLYRLQQSGTLEGPAGKTFILERLGDGASMLAALYVAAWRSSEPTAEQISAWVRYNERPASPAPAPSVDPPTPARAPGAP